MVDAKLRLDDKYIIKRVKGLINGELRGSGAYGVVRSVTVDGVPCIAKHIHDILQDPRVPPADREAVRHKFERECKMLSELRHPNIVHFVGVHYDRRGHIVLIMEALDRDLRSFLGENEPDLPIKLSILQDVSFGLLHLHSQHPTPIIHRDLNPGNILLTRTLRAKIADLGVSSYLCPKTKVKTMAPGAWDYMPPEALRENPNYDTSLDVFSFGHIALCVGTHSIINIPIPPQQHGGSVRLLGNSSLSIRRRKEYLNTLGQKHFLYKLVTDCLHDLPHKRPQSRDLCDRLRQMCSAHPMHADGCNTLERKDIPNIRGSDDQQHKFEYSDSTPKNTTSFSTSQESQESDSSASKELSTFTSSTEEPDSDRVIESESDTREEEKEERIMSLEKRIAEMTTANEALKTRVEAESAQAQVYKKDFEIEREDRVKAHTLADNYKLQLSQLQCRTAETEQHNRAAVHVLTAANVKLQQKIKTLEECNHPHTVASLLPESHLPLITGGLPQYPPAVCAGTTAATACIQ